MRLPLWLKSSLMQHSLAFTWHSHLCVNNFIAKMYTKSVCLQVIQLMFEISIFNLTHKVPLNMSFEIRKSLKRICHNWLTLKPIRQNTAFHLFLHLYAFFGHCYTYVHVNNLASKFQTIQLYQTKKVYHSVDIPLDIGFS